MMELSDEDRAAIKRIYVTHTSVTGAMRDEAMFRAGMLAGLERAAQYCEHTHFGSSSEYEIAQGIRALAD